MFSLRLLLGLGQMVCFSLSSATESVMVTSISSIILLYQIGSLIMLPFITLATVANLCGSCKINSCLDTNLLQRYMISYVQSDGTMTQHNTDLNLGPQQLSQPTSRILPRVGTEVQRTRPIANPGYACRKADHQRATKIVWQLTVYQAYLLISLVSEIQVSNGIRFNNQSNKNYEFYWLVYVRSGPKIKCTAIHSDTGHRSLLPYIIRHSREQ